MAAIELRHVSKRFASATAVADVSFQIHDGEFFILVGPSGCGKSTLLNMIVGLEEPTEGEIRVDGRLVNGIDPKDRNMAMVFQSYAIYPHMTVRENMAFPLKLAKLSPDVIDARVASVAQILELTTLLDRKPRALSGGQRQRVAMGRAIVREPSVFLLDEPLSNLDAKLRVQMRTELARLQRRLGTTTVYVTHDQTEALTLGDRVAVMRQGKVLQVGTPRDLYERPNSLFVAGFVGSPAMNFLPTRRKGQRLELPIGSMGIPEALRGSLDVADGPIIAGFRPDRLRSGHTGASTIDFEARADVVEWLGADVFVHCDVSFDGFENVSLPDELVPSGNSGRPRALVARVDPGVHLRHGDVIALSLDPRHVHLFDAATGERLAYAASSGHGGS